MSANKPYKIKIHEKQLLEVFTPLEMLLEKSDSNVTPELFKKIRKIIYSNPTLIPNSLFQEYKSIKSDKKRNIFVLRDIVSTYYNLRKRELGYPFKREAINMTCLDGDEGFRRRNYCTNPLPPSNSLHYMRDSKCNRKRGTFAI